MSVANILKAARAPANLLLVDTCTIQRSTGHAADAAFGYSDTFTPVETCACLVQPLRRAAGTEESDDERITVASRFFVSFPYGTTVQPQDRVVCNGTTYEVTGNIDPTSGQPLPTFVIEIASA